MRWATGVKSILEYAGTGKGVSAAELLADAKSVAQVVEEMLRFDAPLHMFTRYALEDCEFAGVQFKKGDVAGLLLGAANRDPCQISACWSFLFRGVRMAG